MDLALNVTTGGPTSAGAILRSNQSYLELLGPKTTLEWGIAFCCAKFPTLAAGHQFREVWIETTGAAADAFEGVEAFFTEQAVPCSRWALAEAQKPEPVDAVLTAAGFARADTRALVLPAWPASVSVTDIRVLPARPMRAAFQAVWRGAAHFLPLQEQDVFVEAADERLGDHRMDAFVAVVAGQPAGVGALFQIGDIARLVDFYVLRDFRRRGVGSALLDHAVQLARRLTMRIVCAEVAEDNAGGLAFLRKRGFTEDGRMIEYHRGGVPRPDFATW